LSLIYTLYSHVFNMFYRVALMVYTLALPIAVCAGAPFPPDLRAALVALFAVSMLSLDY